MANKAALLIVDVQLGMFDEVDPVYNGRELLETLDGLIARARETGVPVMYVQHQGRAGHPLAPDAPGYPIHPAIAPRPGEAVVTKRTPDSFHQTTLQEELAAKGIEQLVLAGIQTELCIDTTCRRASSLGYDVTLVTDGHSTWDRGRLSAAQIIA
ncbi:MAG TPA: cysteine hydrolase family protein, partial [Ktedonobacterales bacterium]|nr:cysteine hydrolase family protein [Ktedonobacterales bacterium]